MQQPLTQAQERWEYLRLTSDDRFQEHYRSMAAAPERQARFREIETVWRDRGDPSEHLMVLIRSELLGALSNERVQYERDPALLMLGMIDRQDAVASLSTYQDGSGLALISEALQGLTAYLSQILVWTQDAGFRLAQQYAERANEKVKPDRSEYEEVMTVATTLVRYHLIHQRLYGNDGKLELELVGGAASAASQVALAALHFVCAHEAAHFVLGHDNWPDTGPERRRAEFEADKLALHLAQMSLPDVETVGYSLAEYGRLKWPRCGRGKASQRRNR
jgi:hypothetical protein